MKFLIISPVRNEAAFIEETLQSMISQTLLPELWIIVDDGSTDNTARIVEKYSQRHPFIRLLQLKDRGFRQPAIGVVNAFYKGLEAAVGVGYDVLVKLDGDLRFADDTLERIARAFKHDPKLGITGGVRYEQRKPGGPFVLDVVPDGVVGGPYKFYRRSCFEMIGGLVRRSGWDGVDQVRANMLGWKTGEIPEIHFYHLKPTGSADGRGMIRAAWKYGDAAHYMGGYFWYFLLRTILQSIKTRSPIVGPVMIWAWLMAAVKRAEREPRELRQFLRRQQWQNTAFWVNQGTKGFISKVGWKSGISVRG